jgi:hypothetical protein
LTEYWTKRLSSWEPYRQLLSDSAAREYNPLIDRRLWLLAGLTALLVYGAELGSFTLSIDEELHGLWGRAVWETWLKQGRWGMAFLTYALPPLAALPVLPTLIFGMGLVSGAILFAGQIVESRRDAYAFVAMFVACPIWPHVGEFNTFSWGIGIGLCICALAVYLAKTGELSGVALAGALLAFSISIYQSFLLLYVVAALLHYLLTESGRASYQRSLKGVGGALFIGVALYYAVLQASLFLKGVELTYVQGWVRLPELFGAADAGRQRLIEKLAGLLLARDPIYLGWGKSVLLLPWIGVVTVLWMLASSGSRSITSRLVLATAFAASVAAALSPVVVSAGTVAVRSLVALPLLYAALSSVSFRFRIGRGVAGLALLGFSVFVNAWIATSLFYSDALARDRDAALAATLIHRIEEAGRPKFGASIPITVAGAWVHPASGSYHRVEIFGTSFFEHDGGNLYRIVIYLKLMGLTGASAVPLKAIPESIATIHEMPAWPAPGSVAVVADTVVVKFGELTYPQQISLPH